MLFRRPRLLPIGLPLGKGSRAHGLATIVTAVLCLGSYAAAFAHEVIERHVTCPEHAELAHVAPGQAETSSTPDGTRGQPAPGWQADVELIGDDHCLTLVLNGSGVAPAMAPGCAGPDTAAAVLLGPCASAVSSAEPLYRLAPKTSPPLPYRA